MRKLSEIINNKKKIILKVDQTNDFVYPNELYQYQIYCKNVSGDVIEDVHIQIYNPSEVAIDQDEELVGIEIGDLNNGESHLLFLSARCSTPGEFTVHFICLGEESEVSVVPVTIDCDYDTHSKKTTHKINIYNFSPYEDTYELRARDFSSDVTQLIKKQKLPYKAKENPFRFISSDLNQDILVDESGSYIDQKNILYGTRPYDYTDETIPPYQTDEHSYQYIERESFNRDSLESYEGENLNKIFNDINKYSKFFEVKKIRTGTNKLFHDFKKYDPNGFIHRFGLMSSEIFHNVGVLPTYSYMNDYLFTWAGDGDFPKVIYPKRLDMNWDINKWAGHGWNVWKKYTDEYKEQIENNEDYKPLFEFIYTFENKKTAKEFIENEYKFDASNEFYIHTENGLKKIRKYQYIIKESYYDNGVFFVHIPISKIPSNFHLLTTEQIQAIVERTKPFGMKPLIKYVIDVDFNIRLGINTYTKLCPQVSFEIPDMSNIGYNITPYKYRDIIENICYKDGNNIIRDTRESVKLIPSGTAYSKQFGINLKPRVNFDIPQPTKYSNVTINPSIENKTYACQDYNNLIKFSDIQDLLYHGNFDEISFKIDEIETNLLKDRNDQYLQAPISATDYKLWIDSLSDSYHSYWPPMNQINEEGIDLIELPLENPQLIQENIEMGIGFKDIQGKLYGLSSEFYKNLNSFKIKYATSVNNNFKIKKEGLCDVIGLAYKFMNINSNTLVVFLLKIKKDDTIEYHYFTHIIVAKVQEIFCFTRNSTDITAIGKWSNLIRFGKKNNPVIIFNTPQYQEIKTYDPINITNTNTNWKNLNRIDKNEYSYAIIDNQSIAEQPVDNINIHFDRIEIPNDSIVQDIRLKTIIETNSFKTFYPSIRLQDGFITENSIINTVSLYPATIEGYQQDSLQYYKNEYEQAKINNNKKTIEYFEDKILKNIILNDSLEYSTDYLNDVDDYITVNKSFWIELSDFSENNISMNDIKNIKFCIEGYNNGKEVYLNSQLKENDIFAHQENILIETGYFKKYIPLNFLNSFSLDEIQLRFKFEKLNDDIKIFDTYLNIEFKEKQNINKNFEIKDAIDIYKKKTIETTLNDDNIYGYFIKNGLSIELSFDDLNPGEYYRIYSTELIITYQKQNISFLLNSSSPLIDNNNKITVINGVTNNDVSGIFFNEIIMPESYQLNSSLDLNNNSIELEDAIYQSFTATTDNITSITIYPDGFVGNPDTNLKIALYENKGYTPNRLVKEIKVNGWSKANEELKNRSIITYDFNVNDLIIGNTYWLEFSIENPIKNNYYLLKYNDSPSNKFKLLKRVDNNYINTFGSLKFYVNTLNSFKSFKSLPASEDDPEFSDPKILIKLTKNKGEAKKIKVQKILK